MDSKQDMCKCGHPRWAHYISNIPSGCVFDDCRCHGFTLRQPIKVVCVKQIGSASFETYETTIDETKASTR